MALTIEQQASLSAELKKPMYLSLVMGGRVNDLYYLLNAPRKTREPSEGESLLPEMGEILAIIPYSEKISIRTTTWQELAINAYVHAEAAADRIDSWLIDYPAGGDKVYDTAAAIVRTGDIDLATTLITVMVAGGVMTSETAMNIQVEIAHRSATLYEWGESIVSELGFPAVTAEEISTVLNQ